MGGGSDGIGAKVLKLETESAYSTAQENTRTKKHQRNLYYPNDTKMMNARTFAEERTASYLKRINKKCAHSENVNIFFRDPIVNLPVTYLYTERGKN